MPSVPDKGNVNFDTVYENWLFWDIKSTLNVQYLFFYSFVTSVSVVHKCTQISKCRFYRNSGVVLVRINHII